MAKMEADSVKEASDTPTMAGRLNRLMSSMGSDPRHSATTKAANRTPEPTSRATMVGLPQPRALPCRRA